MFTESAADQPAEPETLRYEHEIAPMVYDRYAGTDGTTFLLLHGIGMGRRALAGLARELAEAGTVIAPDLPGFGDSPEPSRIGTIPEVAELVAGFVEGFGPVVVVGHSMGTQVSVELAARHPELVERLILIAPTINQEECTATKQLRRLLQDLAGESPKVLLVGMSTYLRTGPLWMVGKLRMMLRHDVLAVYPKVAVRTLVMRGELDRVSPQRWAARVASLLQDGELREIPDRRHEAIIQNPAPAGEMVRRFVGE